MIPAGVAALVAGAIACRRPAGRPEPTAAGRLTITSEGSEYAPVLRADVTLQVRRDTLVVDVDSGFVLAPGQAAPGAPALMRALRVTAVLAVPREGAAAPAAAQRPGAEAPWAGVAESPAQSVADSLQLGVLTRFGARRFTLSLPPGGAPARAFVLFRIDGDAVEIPFREGDGRVRPGRVYHGAVRVYACAVETTRGAVDAERAARLRVRYSAAC